MAFYIPAETAAAVSAGGFPPGTGRYPVKITKFEDRGVLDGKGNFSYFIHMAFADGSTNKEIGSCPFDAGGNLAPALAALSEEDRNKKINGMVGALKRVAISAGITEDYMAENGLNTEHLEERTAYIEWLGRPDDVPTGVKAYGEVRAFITKEAYDAAEEKGIELKDTRTFPWRRGPAGAGAGAGAGGGAAKPAGAKLPPPPPSGRAKLPPPPVR
jgi:hypothetical protein